MADVPGAADFEAALGDLQDHLPSWWAGQDPTSNLYAVLSALAAQLDELAVTYETFHLDQDLQQATADGLQRNFALAWGLQREQLPTVLPQLRAYIAARAAEDGSLASLVNTLTSLVNIAVNVTGGAVLTFPGGGGGLTFPSDGSGLALYEFAAGLGPSGGVGLVFPADGSGLTFPPFPDTVPSDHVIANDGSAAVGAGPGLIFASNQFVQIIPQWSQHWLLVKVQNWLTFDRGAFARAVARFQPADWLPTQVVEISTYT